MTLASLCFISTVILGVVSNRPPDPPVIVPTVVVTPTPVVTPTQVVEQELQPDKGWYGVMHFKGSGMSILPDFTVPVPFKFIWKCTPKYGTRWLRIPVYLVHGKEVSDIMNSACSDKLIAAHGLVTYQPGTYTVDILSHVDQTWELLVEVQDMG